MTRAAAEPLANLWDDAYAARLDEPGRLLYRSNLLGGDLTIRFVLKVLVVAAIAGSGFAYYLLDLRKEERE